MIESDQFETPPFVFDPLNERYRFRIDLFSTKANRLCHRHLTVEDDAYSKLWAPLSLETFDIVEGLDLKDDGWLWKNPPYSKPNLERAIGKARREVELGAAIVSLVPATPGAGWFQNHVLRGHDVIGGGSTNPGITPWLQGYEVRLKGNGYEVTVRFLKRRIPFLKDGKKSEHGAKTDSALIEWRPRRLL